MSLKTLLRGSSFENDDFHLTIKNMVVDRLANNAKDFSHRPIFTADPNKAGNNLPAFPPFGFVKCFSSYLALWRK